MASHDDEARAASREPMTDTADVDDLSATSGNDLRKLTDAQVKAAEDYGELYRDLYRQLQIKQSRCDEFYDGILCIVRNKHSDQLKRGTAASIRTVTETLLRGYGYLVWAEDKDFLMASEELDEGEERLVYVRTPREHKNITSANAR